MQVVSKLRIRNIQITFRFHYCLHKPSKSVPNQLICSPTARSFLLVSFSQSVLITCSTPTMNKLILYSFIGIIVSFLLITSTPSSEAFFVLVGNTTACDTCDDYSTYSGRNVLCCFTKSQCCGLNSFDEEAPQSG